MARTGVAAARVPELAGSSHPDAFHCVAVGSANELAPHLAAWEGLERRSLQDNVYLSAPFLASALRHLRGAPLSLVFVYAGGPASGRLAAVAAFEVLPPSLRLPLSTLATSAGPHGYDTFPLLDRELAAPALRALWDWIERPGARWSLVRLDHVKARSVAWRLVKQELGRRHRRHVVKHSFQRPTVLRGPSFDEYLASLPSSRRKGYRRNWRRLTERGQVDVLLHRDLGPLGDLAERFLRLESLGWKGVAGTALACRPDEAEFFRELSRELAARQRVFFVELRLEGRPIAMTANFVAGESLFAFKVAHDPELEDLSPGILAEVQGIRLFQEASDLRIARSGTGERSWVRPYWRDSMEMRSLYVAMPFVRSHAFVGLFPILSRIKARLRPRGAKP